MTVSMIPNLWHSSRYRKRRSWLTKFGSFTLDQLVYTFSFILSIPFSIFALLLSLLLHTTPTYHSYIPGNRDSDPRSIGPIYYVRPSLLPLLLIV